MKAIDTHKIRGLQTYLLMGIAFFIPLLPRFVPALIILFGALSLFAIFKGYRRAQMTEVSILLLSFFVLHLFGLLYTENLDRGFFDIEVKLSLMAFPISFVGFESLNKKDYHLVLKSFLAGVVLAAIVCLGQGLYQVLILKREMFYMLTTRFSIIVHPSYFALYLNFAIIILSYLAWPVINAERKVRSISILALIIFLSVCILLTGSKTGFIMWGLTVLVIAIAMIKDSARKWVPIVWLAVLASFMGGLFQSTPVLQKRIANVIRVAQGEAEVDGTTKESSALRYIIYSSAWDVVISQPWYGQGTGDFQDVLDEAYDASGFHTASKRHLNAHNLFLQSWLALGIPGLVLIIGIFIVVIQQAMASREWVYVGFAALILIISLTESTFNVQAGVVFFSFFVVLFSRRTVPDYS